MDQKRYLIAKFDESHEWASVEIRSFATHLGLPYIKVYKWFMRERRKVRMMLHPQEEEAQLA